MNRTSDKTSDVLSSISVRVHAIERVAEHILCIDLRPQDASTFLPFAAGAHVMLHLGNGLARAYSLLNAADGRYVIAVSREKNGRGGSEFLHAQIEVGSYLTLDPPVNHFPLHEDAPHTVLFAGGIGVTPILAMIRRLTDLARTWELLYCARSRCHAAFVEDITLLARQAGAKVDFHFDDERPGMLPDFSRLHTAAPEGSHFYCCGPQGFMDSFLINAAHLPEKQVHTESFTPVEINSEQLGGFRVVLANTGQEFDVPVGMTIIKVLREHGIDPPSLCEEGTCGSCEVAVIEGEPIHNDHFLSPADRRENATIMICCSSCRSARLVLDL